VSFDRQAIERRDFPITRRGYDPAAVDAHLRALAEEIEELRREASAGGEPSLASAAGTQVQGILQAAESAAADIERQAREAASAAREEAARDADLTREEAIEQARTHAAAVSRATAALLERVAAMDAEASALIESLRAGASRLATDLQAVEANMGELYDAASGRGVAAGPAVPASAPADRPEPPADSPVAPSEPQAAAGRTAAADREAAAARGSEPQGATPAERESEAHGAGQGPQTAANGDLDGARLVALNMALNGESREETERYLAENYELEDRRKLIDEVYAAIEA
jgi:DivIVA domain-containing protein